jgi:MFS family permease
MTMKTIMTMAKTIIMTLNKIQRRLLPLYLSAFSQGLVFWYVVDKVLAFNLGLSVSGISMVLVVLSLTIIILEIPSGILADRWSRKGVLFLSNVFLVMATLMGLWASEPYFYLLLQIFWGAYHAMYSGTYEAILYDSVLEEEGSPSNFAKYYAKLGQYEGLALILGSVVGGLIAGGFSVKAVFAVTLMSLFASSASILSIKEPKIHKAVDENTHLIQHAKTTFYAIAHSKLLISSSIVGAALGGTLRIFWEMDQVWYFELGLPIALYGVFGASIFATLLVRPRFLSVFRATRYSLLHTLLVGATFVSVLLVVPNPYIVATAITIFMLFALSASLVLKSLQQDLFSSSVRAGAASVLSTFSFVSSIPIFLVFGWLIDRLGISTASIFLVFLVFVSAALAGRTKRLSLGSTTA